MAKNQYIVVEGNLSDGFSFHGPFGSFDEAAEWGSEADTWVATLLSPEPEGDEEVG